MMDNIFKDLISEGMVVVYLDDILIFMETLEEHRKITCRVLELLEKHKLYLSPDKCEFEKTTIEYLGVIISHNSIAMDLVKIAGVTEWPALMNKKEVQSFLGFTNFYRRFIRDFLEHACPLFDLTQNDSGWRWGEAERTAFARLKGSVTSAPVLISPDPTKPFCGPLPDILGRRKVAPGRLPLQVPVPRRMELRDPRQGDAGNHPSPPRVAALYQRRGTSVRDLDRPQEPGVLHDGQATEPEASPMVALPLTLRLRTPSQTRGVNG